MEKNLNEELDKIKKLFGFGQEKSNNTPEISKILDDIKYYSSRIAQVSSDTKGINHIQLGDIVNFNNIISRNVTKLLELCPNIKVH